MDQLKRMRNPAARVQHVDEKYMKRPLAMPWPAVDGAERALKKEALERVNAICVHGGRWRKKSRTESASSQAAEGVEEAFFFFDRYDRGYLMANDLRLAAMDQGMELDDEEAQQLLWRILDPSLSTMKSSQPDGATLSQFEKWLWLPSP